MATRGLRTVTAAVVLLAASAGAAAAQATSLKAGVAVSRLTGSGAEYWDNSLVAQTVGLSLRWNIGPVALQPELIYATRGGDASAAPDREQLRIDYLELPVLLVVPFRAGPVDPYAFAGPSVMLETRCRYLERAEGLRTMLSCDPPFGNVFSRPSIDYGIVGGAGASRRLGSGRLSLEARHTWGLRNVYGGPDDREAYNRSWSLMLGYSMTR